MVDDLSHCVKGSRVASSASPSEGARSGDADGRQPAHGRDWCEAIERLQAGILAELRSQSATLRDIREILLSAPRSAPRASSAAAEQIVLQMAAIFKDLGASAAEVIEATRQPHYAALRVYVGLAINGIEGGSPAKRLGKLFASMVATGVVVEGLSLQEEASRRGAKVFRVVRVSQVSGRQTRGADHGNSSSMSFVDPSSWRCSENVSDINDLGDQS